MTPFRPDQARQYVTVQLDPGATNPCPPFGLLDVISWDEANELFVVGPPARDGQTRLFVNGPGYLQPGDIGTALRGLPASVAYSQDSDDGVGPSIGEWWGARAGDYLLNRNRQGFEIAGSPTDGQVVVDTPCASYTCWVTVVGTGVTCSDDPMTPAAPSGAKPGKEQIHRPEFNDLIDGDCVWIRDNSGATVPASGKWLGHYAGMSKGRKMYLAATGYIKSVACVSGSIVTTS